MAHVDQVGSRRILISEPKVDGTFVGYHRADAARPEGCCDDCQLCAGRMPEYGDAASRYRIDLAKDGVTLRGPARVRRVRVVQCNDPIAPRSNDRVELCIVSRRTMLPRAALNDEHKRGARPNGGRIRTFGKVHKESRPGDKGAM